jgi:hypothetical protein
MYMFVLFIIHIYLFWIVEKVFSYLILINDEVDFTEKSFFAINNSFASGNCVLNIYTESLAWDFAEVWMNFRVRVAWQLTQIGKNKN